MDNFHYTSDLGLEGILVNRKMRLTLSTQSNDQVDTVHIYNLIREYRSELTINDEINDFKVIDMILDLFLKYEEEVKNPPEIEKSNKSFILSFTTKGEDRMIWEAYTGNKGYCLKLSESKFIDYINSEIGQTNIFKVANAFIMQGIVYEEDKQVEIIKSILKDKYEEYKDYSHEEFSSNIPTIIMPYQIVFTDTDGKELYRGKTQINKIRIRKKFELMSQAVIRDLLALAPFLKNNYWKDEGETRLVFYRPINDVNLEPVQTDEKGRLFISLDIDAEIFEEVIVGPLNEQDIISVKAIIRNDKIKVRKSSATGIIKERGV